MRAIYKRELKSYFISMTAPLFIAVLVLIMGIYFMVYNMRYGYPYFSYTLGSILIIFTIAIPLLTMRSMSEERRQKTDQLLLTSPVSVGQMVCGKFFSMITVLAIVCLIFCLCPLIIKSTGTAHLLVDYSSILAFFLLGCTYAAIGMLISSMTESTILAAVGTIGVLLLLTLSSGLSSFLPEAAFPSFFGCCVILTVAAFIYYAMSKNWVISGIVELTGLVVMTLLYLMKPEMYENILPNMVDRLALTDIFYNFASYYVFDIAGIVKLLTITAVCLFLTVQVVQKRRWS